jgi:hypothetical protein
MNNNDQDIASRIASEFLQEAIGFRVARDFIAKRTHQKGLLGTMTLEEAKAYLKKHPRSEYDESDLLKESRNKPHNRQYLNNPGGVRPIPKQPKDSQGNQKSVPRNQRRFQKTDDAKTDQSSFYQVTDFDKKHGKESILGKRIKKMNSSLDFSKSNKLNIPDENTAKHILENKSYSVISFGPNTPEKEHLIKVDKDHPSKSKGVHPSGIAYMDEALGMGDTELGKRIGDNAQFLINEVSKIPGVSLYPVLGKWGAAELSYAVVYDDSYSQGESDSLLVSHDGKPTALDQIDEIARKLDQDSVLHVVNNGSGPQNIMRYTKPVIKDVVGEDGKVTKQNLGRECRGSGIGYDDKNNFGSQITHGEKSSGKKGYLTWANTMQDCYETMFSSDPVKQESFQSLMSNRQNYQGRRD